MPDKGIGSRAVGEQTEGRWGCTRAHMLDASNIVGRSRPAVGRFVL